ncbi:brefeldin a-sensitivity 4 [Trichoderma arundinaceum]|uniref:Brefeldin a-sensitivity 4 n=1 Tax=Trichoderma arundinaceum TaxID=490622 RepID=A0A395NMM9_TRIAR|nr:brefeldin a-sensitivity 4 [Trichoderma arundinaceum]
MASSSSPDLGSVSSGPPPAHIQSNDGVENEPQPLSCPTSTRLRFLTQTPPLRTTTTSAAQSEYGSRRSSYITPIDQILPEDHIDPDTFGVVEERDGFFDALFLKYTPLEPEGFVEQFRATLPAAFDKGSPLAARRFIPRQLHDIRSVLRRVTTTRTGIRLLRSFTAYFAAYILCLIPAVRVWLGRYHYIIAVSVILNHPARTLGAQLEGTIFTTIGTVAGMGWGVAGLLLSTSTSAASAGYGGILALFLALFMAVIAWIRSFYARFYQMVVCAGVAIIFTTLSQTQGDMIVWGKLRDYAVPWLLGQAIALLVNCTLFPDAGARPLALIFHESFSLMLEAIVIPRPRDTRLRRRLVRALVDLSSANRDMRTSLTITRFKPEDVRELRNLMQSSIRALLAMETESALFSETDDGHIPIVVEATQMSSSSSSSNDLHNNIPEKGPEVLKEVGVTRTVIRKLAKPTKEILACMNLGLQASQAAMMDLSGYRQYLGPPMTVSSDLAPVQIRMRTAKALFDAIESDLLESGQLPPASMNDSAIVQLFIFARHLRETATMIESLMGKVYSMQQCSNWPRPHLPSYPLGKAIHCVNSQVTHDRGGATAGSYHVTFLEIARALESIKSREYKPMEKYEESVSETELHAELTHLTDPGAPIDMDTKKNSLGYRIWQVMHLLQGYESRYALKAVLVTSLLSIPSYLNWDKVWWDEYEAWWAVILSWLLIHARVGGNIQDLIARAVLAILGAVWGGVAHAAGGGNPYVVAVFATIFMIPMLYRFTLSSHPLQAGGLPSSPALTAVFRGIVFLVGTIAPIVVNWCLWPFVARHELRKSLSSMLFFLSIIYRNVVAKYIYFEEGKEPTPEDIVRSEILEGRIREGFVRIRQLLVMTRHEVRLRGPFDFLPYSGLADSCERFFDYLIAVRQSAVFYNPGYIRDNPLAAQRLLGFRRDAVASILANLYVFAGALRADRKVPRYLPSAAAARRNLLMETAAVEDELAQLSGESDIAWHKKWSDIYSYSYNESLTGCVAQLEELEKFTKLIVGEQGFDDGWTEHYEDGSDDDEDEDEDWDDDENNDEDNEDERN